jgi:DNA-binding response OmpR family regulator
MPDAMTLKLLLIDALVDEGAQLLKVLRAAGFDAAWVRLEREALQHATGTSFHCIVLDTDGFCAQAQSLLGSLRRRGCTTPLIVLTGSQRVEDRLATLEAGADDCLAKPVHLLELVTRIRVLVRRAGRHDTADWCCGDLMLMPLEKRVSVQGRHAQLTPREFALLSELAAARGRVVPRGVILDRVYALHEKPADSAIEYLVHKLRQKIGPERIRTVATVGYAVVPDATPAGGRMVLPDAETMAG